MKKYVILLSSLLLSLTAGAQLKMSVLGDSYSTFDGIIPEGNEPWYPALQRGNDVYLPEQTWWSILAEDNGLQLEKNDSWSGATISYTGYRGEDYKPRSFNTRADRLGDPDIIYIFGGTNDSWAGSPLGEFKYSDWTEQDMYSYRQAMAALLDKMQKLYPGTVIVNICNSELSPEITSSMAEICGHYGVPNIQLQYIDKQQGHPSQNGMKQIAKQVWKETAPLLYKRR